MISLWMPFYSSIGCPFQINCRWYIVKPDGKKMIAVKSSSILIISFSLLKKFFFLSQVCIKGVVDVGDLLYSTPNNRIYRVISFIKMKLQYKTLELFWPRKLRSSWQTPCVTFLCLVFFLSPFYIFQWSTVIYYAIVVVTPICVQQNSFSSGRFCLF